MWDIGQVSICIIHKPRLQATLVGFFFFLVLVLVLFWFFAFFVVVGFFFVLFCFVLFFCFCFCFFFFFCFVFCFLFRFFVLFCCFYFVLLCFCLLVLFGWFLFVCFAFCQVAGSMLVKLHISLGNIFILLWQKCCLFSVFETWNSLLMKHCLEDLLKSKSRTSKMAGHSNILVKAILTKKMLTKHWFGVLWVCVCVCVCMFVLFCFVLFCFCFV